MCGICCQQFMATSSQNALLPFFFSTYFLDNNNHLSFANFNKFLIILTPSWPLSNIHFFHRPILLLHYATCTILNLRHYFVFYYPFFLYRMLLSQIFSDDNKRKNLINLKDYGIHHLQPSIYSIVLATGELFCTNITSLKWPM